MKKKKCLILLPTTYNDGVEVSPKVLNGILTAIDKKFDGRSVEGSVEGTYRMDDGSMARDISIKVWVDINPDEVDTLKRMAGDFAAILKQESVYFAVTDVDVEFVRPTGETGAES